MLRLPSIILSISAASILSLSAATPNWKQEAVSHLNSGDFNKVNSIIKSLSKKEKKDNIFFVDSIQAMMDRIRYDFKLTPENGKQEILKKMPSATDAMIDDWKKSNLIETKVIDGQEWWFRKAVRNLWLLDTRNNAKTIKEASEKSNKENERLYIDLMSKTPDDNNVRDWHKVDVTYTLTVDANAVPNGEIIRAWLPFPFENGRQRNIHLKYSSSNPILSENKSLHHSVYLEQKAIKNKPTEFKIQFTYEVGAKVFPQYEIIRNLKPYNTNSELYKKYIACQLPHIVIDNEMKDLAKKIIGNESNPVKQASLIYDWIANNYPWAGARDYSTIPCLPKYVIEQGHGDCGQVTLLYISLVRSLGIPARWESGWEISATDAGYHDWAETYFEGTGWVPTDMSFGRSTKGRPLADFYKTAIDANRFASNEGVCAPFYPEKKFVRSETVDAQAGEVEWKNGNIPASKYNSNLNVDKFEQLKY